MQGDNRGRRLVTQNLLASGILHEKKSQNITLHTIADLCILIDTICLYDKLIVMGRQAYEVFHNPDSNLADILSGLVQVEDFSGARLNSIAASHLAAFLGNDKPVGQIEPLFDAILSPGSIARALSTTPDTPQEVEMGVEWLQTLPGGAQIATELDRDDAAHRSVTFFARTFLYLAHADESRLPLTPDSARSPVLQAVAVAEKNRRQTLREQLLKVADDAFHTHTLGDEFAITRDVTPLAALVLDRAWPNRKNIAREIMKLRDELTPLRKRLREAEDVFFFDDRREELKAVRKWEGVFKEIERQFGKGEHLLNVSGLLGFSAGATEVAIAPHKPAGWFQLLNLPVEIKRRILARRTIIELHRLHKELPGSGRLARKVEWLLNSD